jgi:ribosomal protein S18 acetylase RimI-like enzyme
LELVMESTLNLQLLTPADWPVLKEARLKALHDSPHAFISHYEQELLLSDLEWRQLFHAATWIVADDGDDVIGLAASLAEPATPWLRHIESIWVAPTHRRRGVFRALLSALADIEYRSGVTDLFLWALEDNHDALRAYELLGFQPTGERQHLATLGRFERRFRLRIGNPLVL